MGAGTVVGWAVVACFAVLGVVFAVFARRVSHWNATFGPAWMRSYNGGDVAPTTPRTFRVMGVFFVAFAVGMAIYVARG